MPKKPHIKFSHLYRKLNVLRPGSEAVLLQCTPVDFSDLSPAFIAYDTDDGVYKLPKTGAALLLLFQAPGGLFTTVRSAYPPYKVAYYTASVGKTFDIILPPLK